MGVRFLPEAPHFAKASWGRPHIVLHGVGQAPVKTQAKRVPRSFMRSGNLSMCYVYLLQLKNGQYYVGSTDDLRRRFHEHASGQELATKRFLPCKLVTYLAFNSKKRALKFEHYLKTGSGFAFRNRHLV